MVCLTLTGCAEALIAGVTLGSAGLTWLALDHTEKNAMDSSNEAMSKAQKDAWIGQCLMNEAHTPQWYKQRANEAFSPSAANEKALPEAVKPVGGASQKDFLKRIERKCQSGKKIGSKDACKKLPNSASLGEEKG